MICESIFHGDRDRAAKRIQAEQWIGADNVDAVDGDIRKQIPIDGVAERFVDAHAVLVNRQTLRGAQNGRGLEAPIQNIGLERVSERVVDIHAAKMTAQTIDEAWSAILGAQIAGL